MKKPRVAELTKVLVIEECNLGCVELHWPGIIVHSRGTALSFVLLFRVSDFRLNGNNLF